jgi:membrane associated rhomboid family serine protease
MAPFRVAQAVWTYRCPSCFWYWFGRGVLENLAHQVQQKDRERIYTALPEADRRELAGGLAGLHKGERSLSPVHALLALFGFPVVSGVSRTRTPWATWILALLLVVSYIAQGDSEAVAQVAYRSDAPRLWAALRSVFLHAGVWHLIGNVYFLLVFGDGVEQRLPRSGVLAAFVAGGVATTCIEGALAHGPIYIVGASGGVAVLIGLCVALHRQARVTTRLVVYVANVSMPVYGVIELAYQGLMATLHASGVAWFAHLSGLVIGFGVGIVCRRHLD